MKSEEGQGCLPASSDKSYSLKNSNIKLYGNYNLKSIDKYFCLMYNNICLV